MTGNLQPVLPLGRPKHGHLLGVLAALSLLIDAAVAKPPDLKGGDPVPSDLLKFPKSSPQCDVFPKFLSGKTPYSPRSTMANLPREGTVIHFVIGTDGATHDVRVVNTEYPSFAYNIVVAVKTWKFLPGRKKGQPVPVSIELSF